MNLIKEPGYVGQVKRLKGELARLMKNSGVKRDQMPVDEGVKQELPDQKIR